MMRERRGSRDASRTGSAGFRPSRWAWTTIAASVLLALLLFAVIVLASDLADSQARRLGVGPVEARYDPTVLEAFERGFAIALVPVIVVAVTAWHLRKKGTEVDERASAILGVLAAVVLVLGLVCTFSHLPEAQGARLSAETALSVLGAALLVASVWIRHVPRPWWPRDGVSG